MRTVEEVELKILAISRLILECEMDAEHADYDLRNELYDCIDSYNNEIDILRWVLNESV